MARHGIERKNVCFHAMISFCQVQRAVIRQEYQERKTRGEMDSLRAQIADEMGVSVPMVHMALYDKRKINE